MAGYFNKIWDKFSNTPDVEKEQKDEEELGKEQDLIQQELDDSYLALENDAIQEELKRQEAIANMRNQWTSKGYDGVEFDVNGDLKEITLSNPHGNHINYIDNDSTRFENYKVTPELDEYISEFSGKYNIDPKFFKALAIGEQSGSDEIKYNREDNDKHLSVGPYQVNPGPDSDGDGIADFDQSYRKDYNLDLYSKKDNVELGAIIFSNYLKRAKKENPNGNKMQWYRDALAAYNMGGGYVFSGKKASDKKIKWNNTKYKDGRVGYMDKIFSLVENSGGFTKDE